MREPSNPHAVTRQEPAPFGEDAQLKRNLVARHRTGALWHALFLLALIISVLALTALIYNILDQTFGLIAVEVKVDPRELAQDGVALEELSKERLIALLEARVSKGVLRRLNAEQPLEQRDREELLRLVYERVVQPKIVKSWSLTDSLLRRRGVEMEAAQKYPSAQLEFRSWLNPAFITQPQSSEPQIAGVRTAILGSLWTIVITILVAFPLGVGAAIYLEEYAADNALNRLIQTNINNLAGVPSIIYGMLGLTIFVRALEPLTSGALVGGAADPTTANGRTIMSAGLTLALLVLPLLIVSAQEAIRAVPNSLREAGYALGATKWQVIWHHVLPNALPGILTGTILSISRAMGETAPLIVVGASTYIVYDPYSPFSKFTTLPVQIYQWTARAQREFHNLAAAAIVVLLVLLLSLNAAAILMRNRFSRRLI